MTKTKKHSLASKYTKENFFITHLIAISAIAFLAGIYLPFLTITKFFIFKDQISILSGLWQLLTEAELILFLVIFLFTIMLPVLKIIFLTIFWYGDFTKKEERTKYIALIHKFGKWSMLDVFVVAIIVVSIKTGILVETKIHLGLYFFLASIIMTMIVTSKIIALAEAQNSE